MVLRGATIITMKGDEVIDGGDIVVTDNRITAVGRGVAVPAGAKVIDVRGKFITPGFVDTHAHWEFRTHDVLEPQNWSLIANLAYGVTAGLDVQTVHERLLRLPGPRRDRPEHRPARVHRPGPASSRATTSSRTRPRSRI